MEMWRENENENKIKLFHYKIWKKKTCSAFHWTNNFPIKGSRISTAHHHSDSDSSRQNYPIGKYVQNAISLPYGVYTSASQVDSVTCDCVP